jgi:hypothetical protein
MRQSIKWKIKLTIQEQASCAKHALTHKKKQNKNNAAYIKSQTTQQMMQMAHSANAM